MVGAQGCHLFVAQGRDLSCRHGSDQVFAEVVDLTVSPCEGEFLDLIGGDAGHLLARHLVELRAGEGRHLLIGEGCDLVVGACGQRLHL